MDGKSWGRSYRALRRKHRQQCDDLHLQQARERRALHVASMGDYAGISNEAARGAMLRQYARAILQLREVHEAQRQQLTQQQVQEETDLYQRSTQQAH